MKTIKTQEAHMTRNLLLLTALLLLFASTAHAAPAVSPMTDGFGFPLWYQDANGVQVQACLDPADPNCIVLADPFFNPALPLVFPTNFPGEFFYFVADSDKITTPGCPAAGFPPLAKGAFTRVAVEGSFLTGAPIPGDQIVFARIRIVVRPGGLCPNTTYAFTHPYGTELVTTDVTGAVVANKAGFTQDIGCAALPCDFSLALKSRVFNGFLKWDPAAPPAAPVGYLGDAVTLHPVIGSLNNIFRIADLTGAVIAQTDLFTVSGKQAGPIMALPTPLAFGPQDVGIASAPQVVTLTNIDPLNFATISAVTILATPGGPISADFSIPAGADTCTGATLVPGGTCTIGISFAPTIARPLVAVLTITHTGLNTPVQVTLSGKGVIPIPPPTITRAVLGRFSLLVTGTDANGDTSVQIFAGTAPPGPGCAGLTQIGTRRVLGLAHTFRLVMLRRLLLLKLGGTVPTEICVMGTPSGAIATHTLP